MARISLIPCSSCYLILYQSLCYPIFNAYSQIIGKLCLPFGLFIIHWSALYRFDVAMLSDKSIHLRQKVKLPQRMKSGLSDHIDYTLILQFSLLEIFFPRFSLPSSTKWELVHFLEMSLSKFPGPAEWWWYSWSFPLLFCISKLLMYAVWFSPTFTFCISNSLAFSPKVE